MYKHIQEDLEVIKTETRALARRTQEDWVSADWSTLFVGQTLA